MTPAEKIRGLWYKANIGYNTGTYDAVDPEVIERFARLVVTDCIDTASEYGLHGGELITENLRDDYGIQD